VTAAGLANLLQAPTGTAFSWEFPERSGRWLLSKGQTWAGGEAHTFVILRDVSETLRSGEIDAWKRLIRVMGHELNNSLTPLLSLTAHLSRTFDSEDLPENWREEARESMAIIHRRAAHLSKFIDRYAQLARLPSPRIEEVDLPGLLRRVASMPQRVPVRLGGGEPCRVAADPSQIEQVFINLIKNAAEAVETAAREDGQVSICWRSQGEWAEVEILDDGTGLSNGESIFVPFYSTKPQGSGIGLTLSFQIVHAHHGRLELHNRKDAPGCVARVCLPLGSGTPSR
jgi:nitrogen fixation/metabolism regulation signal transduction histidine kinase